MRKWLLIGALAVAVIAPAAQAQSPEDKAMAHTIAMRLKESGRLKNYRVGVKYEDGVTWLMGTVSNEEQLHTAVALTERMEGVEHVVSRLDVNGSQAAEAQAAAGPTDFEAALKQASLEAEQEKQLQKSDKQPQLESPPSEQQANAGANKGLITRFRGNSKVARARKSNSRQSSALLSRRSAGRPPQQPAPMGMTAQQAAYEAQAQYQGMEYPGGVAPIPTAPIPGGSAIGVSYDNAQMPPYAWPSYASYPNYSALTYPRQYSPSAWPYIGPFYPYPQVPLGWRKVSLEWDDGWWFLDFSDSGTH